MKKGLFKIIRDRLLNELPKRNVKIQEVHPFNSQMVKEAEEQPYELPMCLIEYKRINWKPQPDKKLQSESFEFVIHIIYRELKADDTYIWDLSEHISAVIHGFGTQELVGQGCITNFVKSWEEQSIDHGNVQDYQIAFSTTFIDADSLKHYQDNDQQTVTLGLDIKDKDYKDSL